jgi:hypothetical protein
MMLDERSTQREQRVAETSKAFHVLVLDDEGGNAVDHVLKELEVARMGGADYVAEDDEEG